MTHSLPKLADKIEKNMQKMPVSNDEEVINVTKHVIYTSMLFVQFKHINYRLSFTTHLLTCQSRRICWHRKLKMFKLGRVKYAEKIVQQSCHMKDFCLQTTVVKFPRSRVTGVCKLSWDNVTSITSGHCSNHRYLQREADMMTAVTWSSVL